MSEQHCAGEPTVSPWRLSGHGTAFVLKVCACGGTFEYAEIEPAVEEEGSK